MTPEGELKKLVTDWLSAVRVPWWRMNAGVTVLRGVRNRVIQGHRPGTADLLIAPMQSGHRVFVWCELKAPGKKLNPAQLRFQDEAWALGMQYIVVHSLEELQKWMGEFAAFAG